MKKTFLSRFQILCAFAVVAPLAVSAAPGVDLKTANDAFFKTGRNRKASIGEVSNAFDRVLTATNLTSDARMKARFDFARFHADRDLLAGALACYEEAFSDAKASDRMRVRALVEKGRALSRENFKGGFATYYHRELDQAHDTFMRIVGLPFATGAEKVEAMKDAANALLDAAQEVTPEAEALFVKASSLPGLTPADKVRAEQNLADYYIRSLQPAKARPILERLLPLRKEMKLDGGLSRSIGRSYVETVYKLEGFDKALDLISKGAMKNEYNPMAIADFCQKHDRSDKELEFKRLATPADDSNPRERSYFLLSRRWMTEANEGLSNFRDYFEKVVIPYLEKHPEEWKRALSSLGGDIMRRYLQIERGHDFIQWYASILARAPEKYHPSCAEIFSTAIQCYDLKLAESSAKEIVDSKDTKCRNYNKAGLALAVIAAGDSDRSVAKVKDWLKQTPPKDQKDRGASILEAARIAMGFRFEKSARALYKAYRNLIVENEPAELACPFIPGAPQNIVQIIESDFYKNGKKGKLDRKYGEHLQFLLETDSAVTGRKVVDGGKDFDYPEIFIFCDELGVKILIDAPTSKEEILKFKQGFGGTASYEAYFAAGFDAPYDFLLIDPGSFYGDSIFNTQYNNDTGYRNLDVKDGSLKISYLTREDSVATLIAISWQPYFNKLPENGTVWYFEPIIWAHGGLSWGGSESVHNRSSFGRLVFENLSRKNKTAIKRYLINRAVMVYNRAKYARNNGRIEVWKDNELGDQMFYAECVKPLCDRLDPLASLVKPEMTDAEVDRVFDAAAETWFNIDYVIAKLRRDYLDVKRISGE